MDGTGEPVALGISMMLKGVPIMVLDLAELSDV